MHVTGCWLKMHRLAVTSGCLRKSRAGMGNNLRGRKGVTGTYVMVQSGGNNKAHGAVYQGSITLYFLDRGRTGEGLTRPQGAYEPVACFPGTGSPSAILFIVIYYPCSKMVTLKKNVAFFSRFLYPYAWESAPLRTDYSPPGHPSPIDEARPAGCILFFLRPIHIRCPGCPAIVTG